MKKFELALETEKEFFDIKMFRVRALISFSSVKKGELGGYVEKSDNLDQSGNAWVSGNACVFGNARVFGDAWVSGNACVFGLPHHSQSVALPRYTFLFLRESYRPPDALAIISKGFIDVHRRFPGVGESVELNFEVMPTMSVNFHDAVLKLP